LGGGITDPDDALIIVRTAFFLTKYHFQGVEKDFKVLMDELKSAKLTPREALAKEPNVSVYARPSAHSSNLSSQSVDLFVNDLIAEARKGNISSEMLERILKLYTFERIERHLNIAVPTADVTVSPPKFQLPLPDLLTVSCVDGKGINGTVIKVRNAHQTKLPDNKSLPCTNRVSSGGGFFGAENRDGLFGEREKQ